MRRITAFILLACIAAGPTTVPAPLPSAKELDALIVQLGHDDVKVREDAGQKLLKIGKPALPALKEALASDHPEVQSRAQVLIKRIETRPVPGGAVSKDEQVIVQQINISNNGGVKQINVQEQKRKITIREDIAGINMTVSAREDGKTVTETYIARNAQDLKTQSPDAFELYDRWAGSQAAMNPLVHGAENLVMRGPVFIGGGFQPLPLLPDPIDELRDRVDQAMEKQKVADEDRKKVADLLDQVQQGRRGRAQQGEDRARQLAEYFKVSDELREKLEALKLPDPGDDLPPPSKWRLGIQVAPVDEKLIVGDVAPGSRGEKIGLKAGDAIEKINGKEVKDIEELRDTLSKTKEPLIITGQRGNEALKLEEKKPTP